MGVSRRTVSKGARGWSEACTPLMAPSGYSRRTLSYLLFSEDTGRKVEGSGRKRNGEGESRGWREGVTEKKSRGREGQHWQATRIYPQTSHIGRRLPSSTISRMETAGN